MSFRETAVYMAFRGASYAEPRNAKGAISAPVLMPVTSLNVGRVPALLQPPSRPAPKAPLSPPPEIAR